MKTITNQRVFLSANENIVFHALKDMSKALMYAISVKEFARAPDVFAINSSLN